MEPGFGHSDPCGFLSTVNILGFSDKDELLSPSEVAAGHSMQGKGCRQLVNVLQRDSGFTAASSSVSASFSPSEGDPVLVSKLLQAEWLLLIECAQKMVLGN